MPSGPCRIADEAPEEPVFPVAAWFTHRVYRSLAATRATTRCGWPRKWVHVLRPTEEEVVDMVKARRKWTSRKCLVSAFESLVFDGSVRSDQSVHELRLDPVNHTGLAVADGEVGSLTVALSSMTAAASGLGSNNLWQFMLVVRPSRDATPSWFQTPPHAEKWCGWSVNTDNSWARCPEGGAY